MSRHPAHLFTIHHARAAMARNACARRDQVFAFTARWYAGLAAMRSI
jgi:hypothetical protein